MGNNTPVLILSALGEVDDRVTGLRAGGDDYLTKPFAFSELLARIEVLNRRAGMKEQETVYRTGDLELDRLSHSVRRAGKEITLQPREFRLLEYLMRHAGQVVTRTMLLENVWDYHFDPQTNVIDVHVSRLRGKIEKGFESPVLHTIRGAGYMLKAATDVCQAAGHHAHHGRAALGTLSAAFHPLRGRAGCLYDLAVGAHADKPDDRNDQ